MKNVIYKIRNVINDHYYVGSTVDSRKRFWAHRKALRNGNHDCIHLQRAWNKYGEDCFKFEIVAQYEDRSELYPAEQKWLDEHFGKDYCYNVAGHADSPMRDATPEMRARLSEKTKAWHMVNPHPRLGEKHSKDTKLLMGERRKGKHAGENHYRYGKNVDEATRKKIGDTQRGVKKAPRTYTPEGLAKARENMKRNAVKQDPKPFSDVLAKFPQEIQDKYDFSNAVYTGALNRIEGCVCLNHGVFSQYAAQFRKGRGCPSCGGDKRAESKRKQMKEFWGSGQGHEVFRKKAANQNTKKFYREQEKIVKDELSKLCESKGWLIKASSMHCPDGSAAGIDLYLVRGKNLAAAIPAFELANIISEHVKRKNFPCPYIEGETPDDFGFLLELTSYQQ